MLVATLCESGEGELAGQPIDVRLYLASRERRLKCIDRSKQASVGYIALRVGA